MAQRVQKEEDSEQYPGYVMPYRAPGTVDAETMGGNTVLRNQDEDDMQASLYENIDCRYAAPMFQEDDSHVTAVYREHTGGMG